MYYMIEGWWSWSGGIVHRHYTHNKGEARDIRAMDSIKFRDGTFMALTVKECRGRRKFDEIHEFDQLIAACRAHGVASVDDLDKKIAAAGVRE